MRPAEQCEDCAHSDYKGHIGICRKCDERCMTVNPKNDCDGFEHPQIRTRCAKEESEASDG